MGLTLPSPADIFGSILFGLIGLVAFRLGRKKAAPTTKWLGVALMFYPYLVSGTWALYLVGIGLSIAAYATRPR